MRVLGSPLPSYFNPRTSVGAITLFVVFRCITLFISIHAPYIKVRQHIPVLLWSYRFSRCSDFPFRVIESR